MKLPTPSVSIVAGKAADSPAYAEAFWRHPMPDGTKKPKKKRLGKMWVEQHGGEWAKRKGRTPDGWLDQRTVHTAAAEAVQAFQAEIETAAVEAERSSVVRFRQLAWEWHAWKRDVKGAAPSTVADDAYLLADPGSRTRPRGRPATGRIMASLATEPIDEIDTRRVSVFLAGLDRDGLEPRNVNKHRALLHAIFSYAMRADTYSLPSNPVTGTDRRKEPPRKPLDFYEVTEVEQLANAAANGAHRKTAENNAADVGPEEAKHRRWDDEQDADFYRVLFGSGMRLGELRDLRVGMVEISSDMSGGWITIGSRLSAGKSIPGSKWQDGEYPTVPIPRDTASAIARQMLRWQDRFGREPGPDDLLFCARGLTPLSDSALRRRYKRVCEQIGLRVLRLHDLRHAAGSLVGRSSSAVFTRDFLRHSKLATTDRYTHSKMRTADALAQVNRAFASGEGEDPAT